jgi:hypothetical protein
MHQRWSQGQLDQQSAEAFDADGHNLLMTMHVTACDTIVVDCTHAHRSMLPYYVANHFIIGCVRARCCCCCCCCCSGDMRRHKCQHCNCRCVPVPSRADADSRCSPGVSSIRELLLHGETAQPCSVCFTAFLLKRSHASWSTDLILSYDSLTCKPKIVCGVPRHTPLKQHLRHRSTTISMLSGSAVRIQQE